MLKSNCEFLLTLAWMVIIAILGTTGIWWALFQFRICRNEGFSFWYCIQHAL